MRTIDGWHTPRDARSSEEGLAALEKSGVLRRDVVQAIDTASHGRGHAPTAKLNAATEATAPPAAALIFAAAAPEVSESSLRVEDSVVVWTDTALAYGSCISAADISFDPHVSSCGEQPADLRKASVHVCAARLPSADASGSNICRRFFRNQKSRPQHAAVCEISRGSGARTVCCLTST